jgi:hypothetical protein
VSAGLVADATTVLQPAVRFGAALEPVAFAGVAAPDFAGALRAAYGAALGLPMEAVLIAGLFNVRTGDTTTFLSTDDVNVAGNSEDAAAVLDGLLGGGGGGGGSAGRRRRAARALQGAPLSPNALNIAGLLPRRNASSAAVAVLFNALAPCPPPCSGAQSTAAANQLRAKVLATAGDPTLLAGVLPPGVAWALNAAAVIPFSMPRVKIRWRLWAWLASLPAWVIPVSATAGALLCGAAIGLWWRRRARAKKAKVAPGGTAWEAAEGASAARSGGGAWRHPARAREPAGAEEEEIEEDREWEAVARTAPLSRSTAPLSRSTAPLSRSSAAWDDGFRAQLAPAARAAPLRPRAPPLQQPTPRLAASPQRAAGVEVLRGMMPLSPSPRTLPSAGARTAVGGRHPASRAAAGAAVLRESLPSPYPRALSVGRPSVNRAAAERAAAQAPDDVFAQQGFEDGGEEGEEEQEEEEQEEEEEEEEVDVDDVEEEEYRAFVHRGQRMHLSGARSLNVKQLDALRQRTLQTSKAKAAAAAKRQQQRLQSGRHNS